MNQQKSYNNVLKKSTLKSKRNFGFISRSCPFLAINVSPAIPIVGGLMFLFVMSVLLRTSFSDPGIIPRATVDEANDVERSISECLPTVALNIFHIVALRTCMYVQ